jgi:CheY-like chemotaxis protein
LVVEDDTVILDEIAEYLRVRQFEVVTSPDFRSGQRALADAASPPDILVTDVNLPDGDGLEFVTQIKCATPPPPRPRVIVMTGHLDDAGVESAKANGAEAVLLKPFRLRTLLQQILGTPAAMTAALPS